MTTLLYSHPACIDHDPGPHHPECPDRLRAVLAALENPAFAALDRRIAPLAQREQLERVHMHPHISTTLGAVPKSGYASLDPDTLLSPASGEAALRAAGALIAAVDAVIAGEAANAFCAVRPPGHHAEPDRAMGFCLFNNIAIGALHALEHYGLTRVAIVDFDVHHGNGTQTVAEGDARIFFASTHQWPLYPGTGASHEVGQGNVLNVPLPGGSDGARFRDSFTTRILPALESFAPEMLFISAGFDAHADDPLAGLRLQEADFAWATERLVELATRHCQGRIVSTLEGGYNLNALGRSAAAHVAALMRA